MIKEVLLSNHPRSGEKNDSDTGRETGTAQKIKGHTVNVQSNHPGAEGLHTCHLSLQLGVEGNKEIDKTCEGRYCLFLFTQVNSAVITPLPRKHWDIHM